MNKYLDLAGELKKLLNLRVKVMPIVADELGTVPKSLENGLEEFKISWRIETILTTALMRSARQLKRDQRPKETCCHLDSSEIPQI